MVKKKKDIFKNNDRLQKPVENKSKQLQGWIKKIAVENW